MVKWFRFRSELPSLRKEEHSKPDHYCTADHNLFIYTFGEIQGNVNGIEKTWGRSGYYRVSLGNIGKVSDCTYHKPDAPVLYPLLYPPEKPGKGEWSDVLAKLVEHRIVIAL